MGGCAPTSIDTAYISEESDDFIQLRVRSTTTVDRLWTIITKSNVNLVRIETTYAMGDRKWFDTIYSPVSDTPDDLISEIIHVRQDTWRDMVTNNAWSMDEGDQFKAGLEFLKMKEDEIEPPMVFSVLLGGKRADIREASFQLSDDREIPLISELVSEMMNQSAHRQTCATRPVDEKWLPESGNVTTGNSTTSGYRYVTQRLMWDDKSGFASSGNYSTYEHEFMLYNYTGGSYAAGTYLGATSTAWPNCQPNLRSSSHNYPSTAYAYLDTRITMWGTCPSSFDEVEFTHGLVFASQISTGTTYTVTMTVASGTTSTDEFKLQGDVGYCPYSSSTCASSMTWGVFSHGSPSRIQPDTDGIWDTTIPGTRSWTE